VLLRNLKTFSSLSNFNFRLYFSNNLVSQAAGNMQGMARSLLVYRLTESAALLGLSTVVNFLPLIFLSPLGGILADRFKKKYVVMAGQLLQICNSLLIAISLTLGFMDKGHPASWWILGATFLIDGVNMGLTGPSFQAMVREIVGAEQVMNAVALGSLAMNVLRFLAPLATGFIIAGFGFATVFYIMAGLLVTGVIFISFIPAVAPEIPAGPRRVKSLAEIKAGFAYVRNQPNILWVLAFSSIVLLFSMPYGSFLPIFADDILKVGETGYGMIISASGFGATLVSVVIASMPNRKRGILMLSGAIALGAMLAGFAFSKVYLLSLVFIFMVGVADTTRNTVANALLLYYSEHEYWGRVMSVQAMVFGLSALGILGASFVVERVGAPMVIGVLALALGVFAIFVTAFAPRLRRLD
jgi:MFS family permease